MAASPRRSSARLLTGPSVKARDTVSPSSPAAAISLVSTSASSTPLAEPRRARATLESAPSSPISKRGSSRHSALEAFATAFAQLSSEETNLLARLHTLAAEATLDGGLPDAPMSAQDVSLSNNVSSIAAVARELLWVTQKKVEHLHALASSASTCVLHRSAFFRRHCAEFH